jgi:uncharacterized protein (TIGR03067 family)
VIVIPADFPNAVSASQLRDVFVHELAHLERLDNLVALLQSIANVLFWPIVCIHLLNRQLERSREEICDNHVLRYCDAVSYGETLLHVAKLACGAAMPAGTVGILQWRGKLEQRISAIIHKGRSKMTRVHPFAAAVVALLFVVACTVVCGTSLRQAQADQPRQDDENGNTPRAEADDADNDELPKLDGAWQVMSATIDHGRTTFKRPEHQWVIKGDQIAVKKGNLDRFKFTSVGDRIADALGYNATFKVDPSAEPPTIDLQPSEGPDRGKTLHGIYSLEGDVLKICVALSGEKRAGDFEAMRRKDRWLITFKRADRPAPAAADEKKSDENGDAAQKETKTPPEGNPEIEGDKLQGKWTLVDSKIGGKAQLPGRGPKTAEGLPSPRDLAPCVFADGRLYVATRMGIQVCDQAGRVNCIIPTPNGKLSNFTFGGENFDTLYATCGERVYMRKLAVKGAPAWKPPIKPRPPQL